MSDSDSDNTSLSGFIVSDSEEERDSSSGWSDDDAANEMELESSDSEGEAALASPEVEEMGLGGIDASNIIVGKRTRRPTNRYVHPNQQILCEDVPESELDAALNDSVGSEEDINSDDSDFESDEDLE